MSTSQPLAILLTCHGWEDFPSHYRGGEADLVLTIWTACWHPSMLHKTRQIPIWRHPASCHTPTDDVLWLLPQIDDLASERETILAADRPVLDLPQGVTREQLISMLHERLDVTEPELPHDLAAAFYGLSYATMQVELLTRQMRYSCTLDEYRFAETVVTAADAAIRGDHETSWVQLRDAFDQLAQERDHYYPVEVSLVDLLLVADSTLGDRLLDEVGESTPKNVLITGELLQKLADRRSDTITALRTGVEEGRCDVVGGEQSELPLPLLPPDVVRRNFCLGRETMQRLLGTRPTIYGRRRFGLGPTHPQWLKRFGYRGALHGSLEHGRVPTMYQAKTTWEGSDGQTVGILAKSPVDAALPETFLYLATQLSQSMDGDHVATWVMAHWPGHASRWLTDLRAASAMHPVLGRFVTLSDYFEQSDYTGHHDRHDADEYRNAYLVQAVARGDTDPITDVRAAWSASWSELASAHVDQLSRIVEGGPAEPDFSPNPGSKVARFAQSIGAVTDVERPQGWLIVNPFQYPRRTLVKLPDADPKTQSLIGEKIVATERAGDHWWAVVDVPSFGYSWIEKSVRLRPAAEPIARVAEERLLQNEIMQVGVDATSGGIASLRDYRHRDNRLGQQLAHRSVDAAGGVQYSRMVADTIETTRSGAVVGEITSRGKLWVDERPVADFRQQLRLWRGSRTLWLAMELNPYSGEGGEDPWQTYWCSRFAWKTGTPSCTRDLHMGHHATQRNRIEAPGFLQLDFGNHHLTLLTQGLPYHRLCSDSQLDTLLIAGREAARQFGLGISVDAKHPWQEQLAMLTGAEPQGDCWVVPCDPPAGPNRSWLLHVDKRHVFASHLELIGDAGVNSTGLRMRLRETEGRAGPVRIEAFRPFDRARTVNFEGEAGVALRVEDGIVTLSLGGHESVDVEAFWS